MPIRSKNSLEQAQKAYLNLSGSGKKNVTAKVAALTKSQIKNDVEALVAPTAAFFDWDELEDFLALMKDNQGDHPKFVKVFVVEWSEDSNFLTMAIAGANETSPGKPDQPIFPSSKGLEAKLPCPPQCQDGERDTEAESLHVIKLLPA